MGIQITHNDDGSITAECGEDELTFFPKTKSKGGTVVSSQGSSGGQDWNPPIPSGGRHKTFLYVPVGPEEPDEGVPIIEWKNPLTFSRDLTRLMQSRQLFPSTAHQPVRVIMDTGKKFSVGEVVSAADKVFSDRSIALHLSGKLFGK